MILGDFPTVGFPFTSLKFWIKDDKNSFLKIIYEKNKRNKSKNGNLGASRKERGAWWSLDMLRKEKKYCQPDDALQMLFL